MFRPVDENTLWRAVFWVALLANVAFSLVGLSHSLEEVHEFRQLQTALTARSILEDGWRLAYPTPLFGPPWSVPMEFPFHQICTAALVAATAIPLEPAGRLISLTFLYLALPAIFAVSSALGLPRARRWLLPAAVLLSPVVLYYSRTFMIESCAFCASLWFLHAFIRAVKRPSLPWVVAAGTFGILAALAKITTATVFFVFAGFWTGTLLLKHRPFALHHRRLVKTALSALGALVPAIAAGGAWIAFGDRVKVSNPLSRSLTSEAVREFTVGTLSQRLSPEFWQRVWEHATVTTLPAANLGVALLFALALGRESRRRSIILFSAFAAGPLLFANLYFVHDYYFYATAFFLIAVLVIGWSQLLDLSAFSLRARRWSVIASLGLQLLSYSLTYFPVQQRPLRDPPELAAILATATEPADVILVFGEDWNPTLAYYAHRRAIMVTDEQSQRMENLVTVLDRLPPDRVTALVVTGELRKYPQALNPVFTRLALPSSPFFASSDTLVYFAEDRLSLAGSALQRLPLKRFRVAAAGDADDANIPRQRAFAAELVDPELTSMMQPKPSSVIHPFALSSHEQEGRRVFGAHAPTDLIFAMPQNATVIEAEFAILASAYEGSNYTDGVEFRVEHVSDKGDRLVLFSRFLQPGENSVDRGLKTLRVPLPSARDGQIWLRTLPGPHRNIACDWAYWARIEIK